MALTKISTGGVKDDIASQAKIADEAVDEARLQVSNAGSNGQFLQKQSGNTGGLTWATVTVPDSDKIEEGNTSIETVDTGSDGHVKISTEGTERVRVIADGKVGIGIAAPTQDLHISGSQAGLLIDGSVQGRVILRDSGATDTNARNFDIVSVDENLKLRKLSDNFASASEFIQVNKSNAIGIAGANYGTSGQVLTSGGASAAPSWAAVPPAGNTVDLVADGAIAAGKPVIIKSNGKAEQVKESYAALSTPTYDTTVESANMPTAYSPIPLYSASADTYAFMYRDSDHTKIICGQLNSSGEWTFGSSSGNISSSNDYSQHASMAIVPASEIQGVSDDVLAVIYREYPGNNDGYFRLGTVNSNKSISLNSGHTDITGSDLFRSFMRPMGNGKIILAYSNGSEVKVMAIDVLGSNAYSTGSESTALSGGCGNANPVYISEPDSNGKAIVMAINNSSELVAQSISVSGTTITLGTEVEVASYAVGSLRDPKIAYNKDDDNFLVAFSNNALQCVAMTISGTTITKSAVTQIANIETRGIGVVYDSRLKHFWVHASRDGNNNDNTNYYYPVTETAATTPSIGTAKTTTFSSYLIDGLNCVYVESDNIVTSIGRITNSGGNQNDIIMIAGKLGSTSSNITTSSSNNVLNYTNILGFAEDAISDGNTGTIKLPGNVVGNQSGLTAGTFYYHKGDGTLATSGDSVIYNAKAGTAISSTKLLIKDPNS